MVTHANSKYFWYLKKKDENMFMKYEKKKKKFVTRFNFYFKQAYFYKMNQ